LPEQKALPGVFIQLLRCS